MSIKATDLKEQIDVWTSIVMPPLSSPTQSQTQQAGHKKQKNSKKHKNASSAQSQTQQTGQPVPGGTVDDWGTLGVKFQIAKMVHDVYREAVRTENNVRRTISYAIVSIFVIWAIFGLYYLMFQNGNIQVLITGSAFITGPLGVVIGYFFGRGDTGWNG